MYDELIDVVDRNNEVIGKEKRSIVHYNGLLHRTVHVFVFDSRGRVFLQKRSASKDVCPLAWDLSAAEHLKSGEDYGEAALRCLREELGVNAKVTRIRGAHLQKNEYDEGKIRDYEFAELYQARHDGEIRIDKDEVASGKFFRIADVKSSVRRDKNQFTPWFIKEWQHMEDSGRV